ncbi:MAG: hypothetical protein RLZ35_575 [Pseudomonadota bacterium]|jgi:hypothetical protein
MKIYPINWIRENLFKLIKKTSSMIETLYLMTVPGMKKSLIQASQTPLDQYSDSLEWDKE